MLPVTYLIDIFTHVHTLQPERELLMHIALNKYYFQLYKHVKLKGDDIKNFFLFLIVNRNIPIF